MPFTSDRMIHRALVTRVSRTFTAAGLPVNTTETIESSLPCLLESTAPKSLALSQGWIERATYVCTWIKSTTIRPGDLLTFEGTKHVIKTVRRDLQGGYWTAILEAEAK